MWWRFWRKNKNRSDELPAAPSEKQAILGVDEDSGLRYFIVEGPPVLYWNCNPYGIDFSPNGRWLVCGCGGWYGNGGIAIVDMASGGEICYMLRFGPNPTTSTTRGRNNRKKKKKKQQLKCDETMADFLDTASFGTYSTVSGVAFDSSGQYLAVSTWDGLNHPAILFSLEEQEQKNGSTNASDSFSTSPIRLKHCTTFKIENNNNLNENDYIYDTSIASGICFVNGKIVVRCPPFRIGQQQQGGGQNGAPTTNPMISWDIPHDELLPVAVDTNNNITNRRRQHRSHAQMAVFSTIENEEQQKEQQNAILVTGSGGGLVWIRLIPQSSQQQQQQSIPYFTPCPLSDQTITAVLALPLRPAPSLANNNIGEQQKQKQQQQVQFIVTGGREGSIFLWRCDNNNNDDRDDDDGGGNIVPVGQIRNDTTRQATVGGAWAAYKPQSIVALCAMDDGRFFSADASGEILEWAKTNGKGNDNGNSSSSSSSIDTGWTCIQRRILPRPGTPRCMAVHPHTTIAAIRGPNDIGGTSTSSASAAILAVGVKAGDGPPGTVEKEYPPRPGFVVCFEIKMAWHYIGHFVVMRNLLEQGRAQIIKSEEEGGKRDAHAFVEALMVELNPAVFRIILSFLTPKYQ